MKFASTLKVVFVLVLLKLVYSESIVDQTRCEQTVSTWALRSLEKGAKANKHTLRKLLFFLHVPRTGGRTYYHCIVRKLYSNDQECPRSYDKLRFDPREQDCRVWGSHDDYSVISKFPDETTSVVTILRNPVDRVFSSYEFSIEVAARFLVHPNLTSATKMTRIRKKAGVNTLEIWPWKYLVPWMREDLFSRREARRVAGLRNLKSTDPYNMTEMAMPLHEYIKEPITRDIVHNGETLQIAGLTNNSYFSEAHQIRSCIQMFPSLGEHVLKVAKKRLDDMLFVGLTEHHQESASMLANAVGVHVLSQELASYKASLQRSSVSHSDIDSDNHNNLDNVNHETIDDSSYEKLKMELGNRSADKLMSVYGDCINSLRKSQSGRRASSLKRIAPANFSKKDRFRVSEAVIEQIKSLNSLDMELYHYAVDLYAKQATPESANRQENLDSLVSLAAIPVFISITFVVTLFLYVNSRRASLKIKL